MKKLSQFLKKHNIIDSDDYWDRDIEELDIIDEKISRFLKEYQLDEEDIIDVIYSVIEDLEKSKKIKTEEIIWKK